MKKQGGQESNLLPALRRLSLSRHRKRMGAGLRPHTCRAARPPPPRMKSSPAPRSRPCKLWSASPPPFPLPREAASLTTLEGDLLWQVFAGPLEFAGDRLRDVGHRAVVPRGDVPHPL